MLQNKEFLNTAYLVSQLYVKIQQNGFEFSLLAAFLNINNIIKATKPGKRLEIQA